MEYLLIYLWLYLPYNVAAIMLNLVFIACQEQRTGVNKHYVIQYSGNPFKMYSGHVTLVKSLWYMYMYVPHLRY